MRKKLIHATYLVATVLGLTLQEGQCMEEEKPQYFDTVPVEYKKAIFECLPRTSVKNLPLVCIEFCDIVYDFDIANVTSNIYAPYNADGSYLECLAERFIKGAKTLHLCNSGENMYPGHISYLPNLHTLYIDSNHYQEKQIGLYYYNTTFCHFKDDSIESLSSLVKLDLGYFTLGITDQGITKLTNLRDLTLGHNNHKITNQGISQMTNLVKLTLRCTACNNHRENYNHINEFGIIALTNLEELSIPTQFKMVNTFVNFAQMTKLKKLTLFDRDHINKPEYDSLGVSNPSLQIGWMHNKNKNPTWQA